MYGAEWVWVSAGGRLWVKDERFQAWLQQIGLGQFADVFEEEGIDLDVIGEYTEEELKGLGLRSGHNPSQQNQRGCPLSTGALYFLYLIFYTLDG